jgi:nitrate reductase NapE component
MAFILLVAFSALFVAGCAAFFSIKGLIVLFSGSALAIGIMASSLEIGKLVAASFLHTHWKRINFLLKLYLCVAVFVLMCITSLGIFGFLTGAYQVHSAKVGTFDTQITALVNEKTTIDQSILEHSTRINALTEIRATQELRVQTAGNLKIPRDQAYKAITEANDEIKKKEDEISQAREKSIAIEKELATLKITLNTTTDIGSFKFIADALHTSVDTAVQYFIFLLICVFDPLAVTLVLAWNNLTAHRVATKKEEEEAYLRGLEQLQSASVVPAVALPEEPSVVPVQGYHSPIIAEAIERDKTIEQPAVQVVEEVATEELQLEPTAAPPIQEQEGEAADIIEAKKALIIQARKDIEAARRRASAGSNDSVMTT